MPVFSYLAYPVQGAIEKLIDDLKALENCEVIPAENKDVLILLTDTPDEIAEDQLQEKLRKLESLKSMGMTYGHVDE